MRLQLTIGVVAMALAVANADATAQSDDEAWTIASDSLVYTDTDNVIVVSPQLAVRRQLDDEGGSVGARVVVDVVSAASVDVVSQATNRFSEVRSELNLSAAKAFGHHLPSASYRFSYEPDYESHGFHAGYQTRLGTADSILSVGYGATIDSVGQSGTPSSVFSESLTTHTADLSLTQVLDPNTLIRGVYTLTVQDGYMEKPYRFVPLFTRAGLDAAAAAGDELDLFTFDAYRLSMRPPEQVPDRRVRNAVGVRGMRYLASHRAAVRLDYMFYFDDWGVRAHMLEPSYHRQLGDRFRLELLSRLYLQSAASFWQRTYVVSGPEAIPRLRTVDRGLSPYMTGTVSGRLEWSAGWLSAYAQTSAMLTRFTDYLYLDDRLALVGQAGVRWLF